VIQDLKNKAISGITNFVTDCVPCHLQIFLMSTETLCCLLLIV